MNFLFNYHIVVLLSSRSGDSTARIWTIADATSRSSLQNGHSSVIVLKHVKGKKN